EQFLTKKKFYIDQMRGWLEYLNDYKRIMFGTDFPLANLGDYIEFVKAFIPPDEWNQVFYQSAVDIYHLKVE
ncbi:MAG: amidohydrolase, partial [Selenomonadaceae bacterium]|nr:amidohydrolase [Selenomonadaceae bacterium]